MEIELLQLASCFEGHFPRTIRLRELRQSLTYEGLLEGLPVRERNDELLAALPNAMQVDFPWIPVTPFIVPPVQTPIEYRGGRSYPFGEPARLPAIYCVSRWESFEFGEQFDYSTLIIIWFQQRWALPIDESVINQIRAVDWERLAHKDNH